MATPDPLLLAGQKPPPRRGGKTTPAPKPAADQHLLITAYGSHQQVRPLMDEQPPTITAGYGGWNEVSRPGRRAAVYWSGVPAYRMSLNVVLDGWADGRSVEWDLYWLEHWATPPGDFARPTSIKVLGRAVPRSEKWWYIDELAYGDSLRTADGLLLRQRLSLSLVEAVNDAGVRVSYPSLSKRVTGRTVRLAPPGGRVALQRLAAREFGDAKFWKSIAMLNGIRTPATVKAGTLLRLN